MEKTMSLASPTSAGEAAHAAPPVQQGLTFGFRAAVDGQGISRGQQMTGHGGTHDAGADPAYARFVGHEYSPCAVRPARKWRRGLPVRPGKVRKKTGRNGGAVPGDRERIIRNLPARSTRRAGRTGAAQYRGMRFTSRAASFLTRGEEGVRLSGAGRTAAMLAASYVVRAAADLPK